MADGSSGFGVDCLTVGCCANNSGMRRRALQFHYQSAATQVAPKEEYRSKFAGPDGLFIGCDYSKLEKSS